MRQFPFSVVKQQRRFFLGARDRYPERISVLPGPQPGRGDLVEDSLQFVLIQIVRGNGSDPLRLFVFGKKLQRADAVPPYLRKRSNGAVESVP